MKIISMTETDKYILGEIAARTCYNSMKNFGKNPNFIDKIILSGHTSVLEHWTLTFKLEYDDYKNNISDLVELASIPGVIVKQIDSDYYFMINHRHIIERQDNYFIDKIARLI